MSRPIGPYSPAVHAGEWVVCSGQLGVRPSENGPELVEGGLVEESRQALANVGGLLADNGLSWADVVKTTVFLTDIGGYSSFNEVYLSALGENRPARSLIAVAGLPMGGLVEVEVWAHKPTPQS
jgi:2-iminobutanoate/2-iminopropanoate deaminase